MTTPQSSESRDNLITLIYMSLILVVLVATVIVVRANTRDITDKVHRSRVENCLSRQTDVAMFDALLIDLARVEQAAIHSGDDPALTFSRRERVRVYRSAALPIPDCTKVE